LRTSSFKATLASLFLFTSIPLTASVSAYEIFESGAFVNSSTLGSSSLQYLTSGLNDFAGSGIDISFTNGLNSQNYGNLTWQFTNNTSITLSNVSLFGFVDAEIVETFNTFFNEYGSYISVTGSGSGDINPDSWEIDEPGYVFGDVYANMLNGALDNTNAVPLGLEDDVSLALGFELGDILVGQTWSMSLSISATDIGGLYHGDAPSGTGAYINGTAVVYPATSVPEPSSVMVLLLGLFGMTFARWQRSA
jgi:hypothetical protein